jgi:hypothetical protein
MASVPRRANTKALEHRGLAFDHQPCLASMLEIHLAREKLPHEWCRANEDRIGLLGGAEASGDATPGGFDGDALVAVANLDAHGWLARGEILEIETRGENEPVRKEHVVLFRGPEQRGDPSAKRGDHRLERLTAWSEYIDRY